MQSTLASTAQAVDWLRQRMAGGHGSLCTDSRRLRPGDAFIAWPGAADDGRRHVAAALQAGASACLVEADGVEAFGFADGEPRSAALAGLKAACGPIAAAWCEPGSALAVVAVTGTNGKTSTTWWLAQALTALGRRCALVGTLGIGEPPPAASGSGAEAPAAGIAAIAATGLTTPDPVTLQAALRRWADAGFAACAIEASSIGIVEHRLDGLPVRVAVFTNFSRDHLDYHGDMADYWLAKRRLFDWPGLAGAVVNIDDPQGDALATELSTEPATGRAGGAIDLWTCAVQRRDGRLGAEDLHYADGGLAFTLVERRAGGATERVALRSRQIGEFNAHNLLAVVATLRSLGVALADAAALAPRLGAVPGRMQRVAGTASQPAVVVDYAHTPDALDKALAALRPLADGRGGRLWCVFGCGGNRDATKLPLLGAIAHRGADRVVLTSDNPRDEKPSLILAQILAGVPGCDEQEVEVFEDRRAAIERALQQAAAADVVLVAGKGHEDYQETAGVRRPFSDMAVAAAALAARAAGGAAP